MSHYKDVVWLDIGGLKYVPVTPSLRVWWDIYVSFDSFYYPGFFRYHP